MGPRFQGLTQDLDACLQPKNVGGTLRIALVVGCVLTLINQADVIYFGHATWVVGVKVGLNFVIPFVVSNLGVMTASKNHRARS